MFVFEGLHLVDRTYLILNVVLKNSLTCIIYFLVFVFYIQFRTETVNDSIQGNGRGLESRVNNLTLLLWCE